MSIMMGFVGAGNIVSAILSGAEKNKEFEVSTVAIYDINKEVREDYQARGYTVCRSIPALVEACPTVVLAVKPQMMESIMPEVSSSMAPAKTLVSVAAGIGSEWLAARSGTEKIVCCMPNTPAATGIGAFALSRSEQVDDRDFVAIKRFFERVGLVEEVPEALMLDVPAVSGSTPAFFYRMAQVVVEEAVAMGFEEKTALRLFAQAMKGSAQMLMESEDSAAVLERKVCSPKGTTLAALERMDELGFNDCIKEGMRACSKRCRELLA